MNVGASRCRYLLEIILTQSVTEAYLFKTLKKTCDKITILEPDCGESSESLVSSMIDEIQKDI